jgi:hypothetical protein
MPANIYPIFTLTPNIGFAEVDSANTESGGTGALDTLFTAGADGSMVFRIRYRNAQSVAAASSANVIRFFLTDTGGINPRLLGEIALPAATRTTAVIGAGGVYSFADGLTIASGQLIQVIQSVYAGAQDLMHYIAEGGDF